MKCLLVKEERGTDPPCQLHRELLTRPHPAGSLLTCFLCCNLASSPAFTLTLPSYLTLSSRGFLTPPEVCPRSLQMVRGEYCMEYWKFAERIDFKLSLLSLTHTEVTKRGDVLIRFTTDLFILHMYTE